MECIVVGLRAIFPGMHHIWKATQDRRGKGFGIWRLKSITPCTFPEGWKDS
jgi:hypothetical protein